MKYTTSHSSSDVFSLKEAGWMTRSMAMENIPMQMETPTLENGLTIIGLFHSYSDVSSHPVALQYDGYFQSVDDWENQVLLDDVGIKP